MPPKLPQRHSLPHALPHAWEAVYFISKFDITVHPQPRPEDAGHLARRIFQGWRAASGRATRTLLRAFSNRTVKFRIAAARLCCSS